MKSKYGWLVVLLLVTTCGLAITASRPTPVPATSMADSMSMQGEMSMDKGMSSHGGMAMSDTMAGAKMISTESGVCTPETCGDKA